MLFRRDRAGLPSALVAGVVVLGTLAAVLGARSMFSHQAPSVFADPVRAAAPFHSTAGLAVAPPRPGTAAFARVEGLSLHLPASSVIAVMYHEAAMDGVLAMRPLGTCVRNANRYKFSRPHPSAGPAYTVMSSRGRYHPATSAVDVVMDEGTTVLSPVTGFVAHVKRYRLYGRYADLRLSIVPAGRPELRVVMIHVADARVVRGSIVVAGVTPLGVPRPFPFRSQVHDYLGAGPPHVHIEVKSVGPSGIQASS